MSWRVRGMLWFNFRDTSLFGMSSPWLYFTLKGLNLLLKSLGRSFTPRWICISFCVTGTVLSIAEASHCFQQDNASEIRLLCKHWWMLSQANVAKVSSSSECWLNDRETESRECDQLTAIGKPLDLVPFKPGAFKERLERNSSGFQLLRSQ